MIVVLNHKSNLSLEEIKAYYQSYCQLNTCQHQLIVCPSSCYLPLFKDVTLGSQDVSRFPMGSYTGDISVAALSSLNVTYTLINHSERNIYHQESLEIAREKLKQAKSAGLKAIICIGETKEEHKEDYISILKNRLVFLLEDFPVEKAIIAYEPIYAIGTGKVPTNEMIEDVITALKEDFSCPILYGGSVNENNISTLKTIANLDGFLLGGVSLKLDAIQSILENLENR